MNPNNEAGGPTEASGLIGPTGPSPTTVSVVFAIKDEAETIEGALRSVWAQTYPHIDEILIAIAPSSDDTWAACRAAARTDPRIQLVENPEGWVSFGLNRAIAASTGEIVVRVDGHCRIPEDYVATAVETLQRTGAGVVGGVQRAVGGPGFSAAVATAMSSPLGVGNATFHYGAAEGEVDTVFLGVFQREALERVGGYDEQLLRNQDYDLNYRIRKAGYAVWFNPAMAVEYQPRSTVASLGRQYYQYGWWKLRMLAKDPHALKLRQLAPPAVVAGLALSTAASIATRRALLAAPVAAYAASVAVGGWTIGRPLPPRQRALVPIALATMHLSWGSGFLRSLLSARSARRLNP
jgi:GT2 family glycosyltransferase